MTTWFITGTSSGLGRIMTEALLQRGDRVAATVRRKGTLEEFSNKHGGLLREVVVDLTNRDQMQAEVAATIEAFGRVDAVVSNAAYGLFGAIEELSDEQIDRQIATNLGASIHLVRAFLPHFRNGGGKIIQVSSEGGQTTYPGFGLYHATKWGIEGYIETLSKEVAAFGIQCMIVEPGPTGTNFRNNLQFADPMDAYSGTPADQVRQAIHLGSFELTCDAEKSVVAMIAAADAPQMPLRLALGSTAFENIQSALMARLNAVRAQKDVALSADR